MKQINKIIAAFFLIVVLLFSCTENIIITKAEARGTGVISNVNITFSMPPVNAADVSALSVSTSTGGCFIRSAVWYDIYGKPITNKFTGDNATIEIVVEASTGNYFSGDVAVTVGGGPASVENYGSELHISKSFSPVIWAPTMVKQPGNEKVQEGGVASFVSYSSCTDKSSWEILDTNGALCSAEVFAEKFPDLFVDISFGKLNISPVPMELNGYKVRCCFTGPGGYINSNYATITVEKNPNGSLPADQTVHPSATPTTFHEHVYSSEFTYDAGYHWHACDCGEELNAEEHSYVWIQKAAATAAAPGLVQGECSECGYIISAKPELGPLDKEKIDTGKPESEAEATEETAPIDLENTAAEKQGFFKRIFSFVFRSKSS